MATSFLTLAASTQDAGGTNWAALLVAILGSGVVGTMLGGLLTSRRELAAARRERYAKASRLLTARLEYPYRIRRRTSNSQDTLEALADRGHDLQEQLAEARAWVTADSAVLGTLYGHALAKIDEQATPASQQAWTAQPASTAAAMNITDFGPRSCHEYITQFECATRFRFGWRRLLPPAYLRRRLERQ